MCALAQGRVKAPRMPAGWEDLRACLLPTSFRALVPPPLLLAGGPAGGLSTAAATAGRFRRKGGPGPPRQGQEEGRWVQRFQSFHARASGQNFLSWPGVTASNATTAGRRAASDGTAWWPLPPSRSLTNQPPGSVGHTELELAMLTGDPILCLWSRWGGRRGGWTLAGHAPMYPRLFPLYGTAEAGPTCPARGPSGGCWTPGPAGLGRTLYVSSVLLRVRRGGPRWGTDRGSREHNLHFWGECRQRCRCSGARTPLPLPPGPKAGPGFHS